LHDVALMLTRVRVQPSGEPAPPASRVFWRRAFDGVDVPDDPARLLKNLQEEGVVDAGWLAQNVCVQDVRIRGEHLDQLSFGQRVFAAAPEAALPDALVAVRTLPRFRMLILTLERMGLKDPRVYAAAARHAGQLTPLGGRRAFVALGQIQGALAVMARLARVHRLPPPVVETLTASLLAQPFAGGAYAGAIARWIDRSLRPALQLPADADVDEELVHALAGVETPAESLTRVAWEGRSYRIDFVTPERSRLTRAREKMAAPPVGAALEIARVAADVSSPSAGAAEWRAAIAALKRIGPTLPAPDKKYVVAPDTVEPPPNATDVINRAIVELTKIADGADRTSAPRVAEQLAALSDDLLAQALMSLAYALYIGEPDGTTLLGGDPSRRHDFRPNTGTGAARLRSAWAEPQEITMDGARHLTGSLLGLDVGLSALALRRINVGSLPPAPTLTMPDRQTFVKTIALMNPLDLSDADRDAIVAAIGRGRARVAALQADAAGWDAAADQLGIDGWRRRAGRWAIAHDAATLPSFVSLSEL
ncbi:MAG TPA: hypothetical protein VGY57_12020, partial [Vicinamibacterales bacterium]|nr:hypothetical protein [Vicinamibacterales bacterium]